MGNYSGHNTGVDSSGWSLSTGTGKDGEEHPSPAPMVQTDNGMERAVTPDPYARDGANRNFGRNS